MCIDEADLGAVAASVLSRDRGHRAGRLLEDDDVRGPVTRCGRSGGGDRESECCGREDEADASLRFGQLLPLSLDSRLAAALSDRRTVACRLQSLDLAVLQCVQADRQRDREAAIEPPLVVA